MIQPDRLKELIEQEATIYGITGLPRWVEEINLGSLLYEEIRNWLYKVDTICYGSGENDFRKEKLYRFGNEDLFETREEAEWALEFGNITREEKLVLPSWEEFLNKPLWFHDDDVNFLTKDNEEIGFYKTCFSKIIVMRDAETVFNKPLTEENYIEACKLVKKLFLGENNE